MQSRRDTTTPQARLGHDVVHFHSSHPRGEAYILTVFPNQILVGAASPIVTKAFLAQWLERAAVNRKVAGSIPAGGAFFCVAECSAQ